ncbi:MAG: carboxypeptidase-like regulatory domain-containing protein, partial [Prevotellaceae bacterium]|nr:carboxypeptidase-like regulatory domain-containing protein [Prevotellaceae bacterium]
LKCSDMPLTDALRRVERLSEYYKLNFNFDELTKYKVTATIKNKPAPVAVDMLIDGLPLTATVSGRFINVGPAQQYQLIRNDVFTAKGRVTDQKGEPLQGVTVRVKGTKMGTVTDTYGRFSIAAVTPESQLVFSYIGMQTLERKVSRKMIEIILDDESTTMGDVVVTGIFRKSRESYTGSVATISSEKLRHYRGQNLLQTLKNADASINFAIDNLNGSNPNKLPDINIRGNSSLPMSVEEFNAGQANNPNTPLVIMDGFEISLTKLMDYNDEEIESINILKDAAATAIYGSRGANGVIVVVTKRPEPGQLKVSLEAGLQLEVPDLTSYHLLDAADKLELERKAGLYDRNYTMSSETEILLKQAYQNRLQQVLNGVNTDWMSKPLHTGVGQRYNLRLEGGSSEFRWSADAQYNAVEGAMKGSDRRTFNGGITLLYMYKNLTFRNYTSIGFNNSHESPYGTFSDYVNQQPYNAPYDADGQLRKFMDPFYKNTSKPENPLYNASLGSFD